MACPSTIEQPATDTTPEDGSPDSGPNWNGCQALPPPDELTTETTIETVTVIITETVTTDTLTLTTTMITTETTTIVQLSPMYTTCPNGLICMEPCCSQGDSARLTYI